MEELGQNVLAFRKEQAPNPGKSFFKYEFEWFTLDLLPVLKAALKFNACYAKKELVTFEKVDVPFIGYDELLLDKAANARPKDIEDIEQLESRRKPAQ